ncbi:hypothetical protein DERF_002969 [Dermatophagoides farinae]|uniref:Uncharacterized protein n=1 Tax=Dermatophagoides farinae TaxID=6954 RepID=A0A922LDF7_DERFA|nr:hypothetical protein DERF_002969 [Dermatophagoides farinae]
MTVKCLPLLCTYRISCFHVLCMCPCEQNTIFIIIHLMASVRGIANETRIFHSCPSTWNN